MDGELSARPRATTTHPSENPDRPGPSGEWMIQGPYGTTVKSLEHLSWSVQDPRHAMYTGKSELWLMLLREAGHASRIGRNQAVQLKQCFVRSHN